MAQTTGQPTKDWTLYEAGVQYNEKQDPPYNEMVEANWDFFSGNQWRNLPDSEMPKPVFNVIKRVITFQVASLTSTKAKISFEPMMYDKDNPDPSRANDALGAEIANKQAEILMEKWKMQFKTKEALFDAAVTGDAAAHLYFDMSKRPYGAMRKEIKGEICLELVDGSDVMCGNANTSVMENQPYVIVSGRDTVSSLQAEADAYRKQSKKTADAGDVIKSDSDYTYSASHNSRVEVEADEAKKARYIIVYRKKKSYKSNVNALTGVGTLEPVETIIASKSTRSTYIFQNVDTGLSYYPVAFMNWEKQKNTYHGRGVATGMLPNQIFINRQFAMAMFHLMRTAFPKAVYNADIIEQWDDAVGSAIGVSNFGPEIPLTNIAGYLEAGNMSPQIIQVLELAMQYTKEMLGVSDGAMGNIDPKNTSAIIAVSKAAAVPLENPKTNLYEWYEDIGRIMFDMMGTYYGLRPVMQDVPVMAPDPQTGQPVPTGQTQRKMQDYDFSQLKDVWLDVKANVGESSYWSEIAASQTLDNLLAGQHIDIIQYLERQPDDLVPRKDELIKEIQERQQQQAQAMQQQQQMMMQQQQGLQQQTQQEQAAAQQAAMVAAHHKRADAQQKFEHAVAMKHLDTAQKLTLEQAKAQAQNQGAKK